MSESYYECDKRPQSSLNGVFLHKTLNTNIFTLLCSIQIYLFGDDTTDIANNSFCLANLTMNKVPKSEKEVRGGHKLFLSWFIEKTVISKPVS